MSSTSLLLNLFINTKRVETIPPDVLADVDHHVNLKQAQFLQPTKPSQVTRQAEIQKSNIFEQNDEDIEKESQHDTLIIRPPVVMRTIESQKRTKVVNQMTASFVISQVKPTPEGAGLRSNARQEAVESHRRANFEAEGSSFKPLVNHHQRLYKGTGWKTIVEHFQLNISVRSDQFAIIMLV